MKTDWEEREAETARMLGQIIGFCEQMREECGRMAASLRRVMEQDRPEREREERRVSEK